jgi:hypothetical protein
LPSLSALPRREVTAVDWCECNLPCNPELDEHSSLSRYGMLIHAALFR